MLRFLALVALALIAIQQVPSLQAQIEGSVPIGWDPGTAEQGTVVQSSDGLVSGDFLFRISPQTPTHGTWRTILNVEAGEADLFLRRSGLPNPDESTTLTRRSTRVGSADEAILLASSLFGEGQEWYILVRCVEAQWTLSSGELFVRDLGALGFEDSNESGAYEPNEAVIPETTEDLVIGPEGLLFFRTVVPDGTPAWSLQSSDPEMYVHVRKGRAALSNAYDLRRKGQMLVVPTYLQASSAGSAYFVSVSGAPGEAVSLTSAIHAYEAKEFQSTTTISSAIGGYSTFQFQVPPDQIGWELQLVPSEGDPNFSLRRDQVPSEYENNALSEATGTVVDSVTLTPASGGGFGLSDGTFYVTVYSEGAFTAELISGDVGVDPIEFEGSVVNSLPDKAGWHYYILDDLDSQVGLGWELLLADQVEGTEIAVRRNAIPSRWKYRTGSSDALRDSTGNLDRSVKGDLLQLPRHQKDVWYVGIYLPGQALGAYTLTSRKIATPSIAFNGSAFAQESHELGVVRYFRVDVPFDAEGWNFVIDQMREAGDGDRDAPCTIAIAKDTLPTMNNAELFRGPPLNREGTSWVPGGTWQISTDWTGISKDNDGARRYSLCLAKGNPLSGGSYYVGIIPTAVETTYRIRNQGIGYGESWQIPIREVSLEETDSSFPVNDLPLGELQVIRLTIPEEVASRTIELGVNEGEALMAVKRGGLASALASDTRVISAVTGALYRSTGDEFLTLLPHSGEDAIKSGDYFFTLVSQGAPPSEPTDSAPDPLPFLPVSMELRNAGPLPGEVLGEVPLAGIEFPVDLEGGRLLPVDFTVPSEGVVAVQVSMTLEGGAGSFSWWQGPALRTPAPVTLDGRRYGYDGGEDGSSRNDDEIARRFYKSSDVRLPIYSTETIGATFRAMLRATPGSQLKGTLNIRLFGSEVLPFETPEPVTIVQQLKGDWRYFEIEVPEEAPLAWSLEIGSITDVDDDEAKTARVTATLRRDQAPPGGGQVSLQHTSWASGYNYSLGKDWTGYEENPDGSKHLAAVLPLGRPLEPGRYYLGVLAVDGDVSYQVRTRGIGEGFAIPVVDVPYGEDFAIENLEPREASYYRIQVPAGTPNWVLQSRTEAADQGVRWALSKDDFVGSQAANNRPTTTPHGKIVSREDYPSATDFEESIILPDEGLTLQDSTYYLAVISEGTGADSEGKVVGVDPVTVAMTQPDPLPVTDLGTFVFGDEPSTAFALEPGGTGLFKLTVPEASIEIGVSVWVTEGRLAVDRLSGGQEGIVKARPVSSPDYGVEGGQNGVAVSFTGLCQPIPPGTHYFTLRALKTEETKEWQGASGFMGMDPCVDVPELAASKGLATLEVPNEATGGISQGAWSFWRVDMPEGPDAWELLVESWYRDTADNLQPGDINVVIRRDQLPTQASSSVRETDTEFLPGASYWVNQQASWTKLDRAVDNAKQVWSVLPMGKPLEPGRYVIGIYAKTRAVGYYVRSCLIGDDYDVPIMELPFSGENAVTPALSAPPTTALYYKVSVPTDTRSWQLGLDVTRGDWSVAIRHDGLPGSRASSSKRPEQGHGFLLDKGGSEHLLLLPEPEPTTPPAEGEEPWQPYIEAGDYFIALASKGAIPSSSRVGPDPAEGSFFSAGTISAESIGSVTSSGLSHVLEIDGGKSEVLEFHVPAATPALEIRLDGRVGNPQFALWTGNQSFLPRPPSSSDTYGFLGGEIDSEHRGESSTIYTFTNVAAGNYRIVARASRFNDGYPNANATLRISHKPNLPLAFGPALASETLTNVHRATLAKGQKNIYEIQIPPTYEGEAILGWMIMLDQIQGTDTRLKLFHQDGGSNPEVKVINQNTLLVVPPWWQADRTWYLSVEANTITDYEISSGPVETQATWTMPEVFDETFGRTEVSGQGDPAQEISEDGWHFYAIEVPEENLGLLRTFLTAVSGSPDMYLREGAIPTIDHRASSQTGGDVLYDRQLTGDGSSYGNWVSPDSRFEPNLTSGTYYLGVRANNNQNARYRLEASTGKVEALNLESGAVADVNLTGGDWRYYYVDLPKEPLGHWTPLFNRSQGDARLYVRDTAPPGFGATRGSILTDATDRKNLHNVYQGDGFEPGMIDYPFPPLRPGSRYYVGIHGSLDSSFSLEMNFTEREDIDPMPLAFRNGYFEGEIPPESSFIFQVEVPFGATEWKHTSIHSSDVSVRVDQGTLPPPIEVTLNTSIIQTTEVDGESLGEATISATGWPRVHEKDYFIVASNPTETSAPFSIAMNGALPPEKDDDSDGLPDLWEEQYFSNIAAFSVGDDVDGDGISNLIEFALDLSPAKASSFDHEAVEVTIEDGVLVMTVNKTTLFDISHLVYTVEASYDSKEWNTHETNVLTDNPQQLIVADVIPIVDAELRFLRLRVTMEPVDEP